jgi:hypothetical protein
MNKLILLFAFFSFALVSQAQAVKEKEVPAAVVSQINSLYPDASKAKWTAEDGFYEASFKAKNVETSVLFSMDGRVIFTEIEIDVASLPQTILAYVKTEMANAKIAEASKIIDVQGATTYEAEVNGIDYIFSSEGHFLSKKEADDEDSNDD